MRERNEVLDFLKGISIILVVLNHNIPMDILDKTLYWYHIGQAVPIFMIVSGYLSFMKYSSSDLKDAYNGFYKVLRKIMVPFLVVTFIQVGLLSLMGSFNISSLITNGGIGPGSYYPWVFIQCALIIPLIVKMINKISNDYVSGMIIIGLSSLLNIVFSLIDLPLPIYRLLAVRYIFYLYLGCMWRKNGIKLNLKTITMIVISALFVWLENYKQIKFSPLFYNSWQGYNWLGAFYSLLLIYMVNKIYLIIRYKKLKLFVNSLGQNSFKIFLNQMFIFSFLSPNILYFIQNQNIRYAIYIVLTLIISIFPVMLWSYRNTIIKFFKK